MASANQTAHIHVFGGTSDALAICRQLEQLGLRYSLSVATETGEELATDLQAEIIVQRMTQAQMVDWLQAREIRCVIDATHPFAAEVSTNILGACQHLQLACLRFERPSQISAVESEFVIKVDSVEQACEQAKRFGERVFLTTGSKQLADYVRLLPEKQLIARVLPTVSVIQSCYDLGLGVGNIVAMKGPFSAEINEEMYRFYQADVVITKESGDVGGYQEKVKPCLALGIPCIVITRPVVEYAQVFSDIETLVNYVESIRNRNKA